MITDSQTNFLFIADSLKQKHPRFLTRFKRTLKACGIQFDFIPGTKDVWAVDYMPVQVALKKFIQFTYNPDYLQGAKKWGETISDVSSICKQLNLKTIKSNIVLDGGNVIRGTNKVIMCEKIFKENPLIPHNKLLHELEQLFEIERIVLVPQQPHDSIGHADGMVRFLDNKTVLINDYSKEKQDFQISFKAALKKAGLSWIEIPYNPYQNKSYWEAKGIYINYLQMQHTVILPTFGLSEDDLIVKQFEQLFIGQTITTVPSNEIARDGGVLNCISWNIFSQSIPSSTFIRF